MSSLGMFHMIFCPFLVQSRLVELNSNAGLNSSVINTSVAFERPVFLTVIVNLI